MTIKAPYLSREDIRVRAEAFLDEYHPSREIPIPIEKIIDVDFGMDIIPTRDLERNYDTVALLHRDLTAMNVDAYVSENQPGRYNFSLAHEMGHRILHAEAYQSIHFASISEWKEALANIPEREYGFLEYQANEFAGHVLVPTIRLRDSLAEAIEHGKASGFAFHDMDEETQEAASNAIAEYLRHRYEVSAQTITIRINREGLWDTV